MQRSSRSGPELETFDIEPHMLLKDRPTLEEQGFTKDSAGDLIRCSDGERVLFHTPLIRDRGWTRGLIGTFLGAADGEIEGDYSGRDIYLLSRILKAEQSPVFQARYVEIHANRCERKRALTFATPVGRAIASDQRVTGGAA